MVVSMTGVLFAH